MTGDLLNPSDDGATMTVVGFGAVVEIDISTRLPEDPSAVVVVGCCLTRWQALSHAATVVREALRR